MYKFTKLLKPIINHESNKVIKKYAKLLENTEITLHNTKHPNNKITITAVDSIEKINNVKFVSMIGHNQEGDTVDLLLDIKTLLKCVNNDLTANNVGEIYIKKVKNVYKLFKYGGTYGNNNNGKSN